MKAVPQNKNVLALKSEKIGRALILLFLIKPTLDLLWFLPRLNLGGVPLSILHVMGFFVLAYFGRFLFTFKGTSPPLGWLFRLFIIMNLVAAMSTMFTEAVKIVRFVDIMIRIVDSYIIFNVAYFAALYYRPNYYYNLVRSVSAGATITLFLNFVAIVVGYEGNVVTSGVTTRISGLYSDPGVLANVAVYAIIFTVFWGNMFPGRSIVRKIYLAAIIIMAFYVIYTGLSRSAFVQLCVFGIIYIAIFKKGVVGRLVPPLFLAGVFVAGTMSGLDYYKYVQRFGSEIAVFTEDGGEFESGKDKEVDFGKLEHLGSNRGALVAYKLDKLLKRPFHQNMIGNFNEKSAHSDYIDVYGRNGLVGLFIYVCLLLGLWFKAFKYSLKRDEKSLEWKLSVLGLVLISLYILYSFPFRPLSYTTIAWFMWAVLGTMLGASRVGRDNAGAGEGEKAKPRARRSLLAKKVV